MSDTPKMPEAEKVLVPSPPASGRPRLTVGDGFRFGIGMFISNALLIVITLLAIAIANRTDDFRSWLGIGDPGNAQGGTDPVNASGGTLRSQRYAQLKKLADKARANGDFTLARKYDKEAEKWR